MLRTKKIKVVLETQGPFRIGGRKDPFSGPELPVIKLGNQVVIPGTSLKGALREQIERYLITEFANNPDMKPCVPTSGTSLSLDERYLINRGTYRGPTCHYPCSHEDSISPHGICPVCYLLGAQGLVGFVTIPFLYTNTVYGELPANRIDRAAKVVAAGNQRFYQLIPNGTKFEGILKILIEDPLRDWKFGKKRPLQENTLGDLWLCKNDLGIEEIIGNFILDRLKSITVLGGLKSSGAGEVTIDCKEI